MTQNQFPPQTRTQETVAVYSKRAKSLAKKAIQELSIPPGESLDPRQFVAWLSSKKTGLAKTSWRQYKSAVICFLEGAGTDEAAEALDFLREIGSEGSSKGSDKTSGTKLKRLPWRDFVKLTDHLRTVPGKWHNSLLDWIISSTLTGLRPQEWARAEISGTPPDARLVVQNAKNTNGRAHGDERTLLLTGLTQDENDTLARHVERARNWAGMGQFDSFYDGCSLTLYHLCRKLWPKRSKHITLYSCRHQFSANAKASGFSTVEIAAMMGHAVDTTATRHYGKKTAGQELLRVQALPEEVERVDGKFAKNMTGKNRRVVTEPAPKVLKTGLAGNPGDTGITFKSGDGA